MIKCVYLYFLIAISFTVYGQKPPVSLESLARWTDVSNIKITTDGQFAVYVSVCNGKNSLHVRKLKVNSEIIIPEASDPFVSRDNRFLIFQKGEDSIAKLKLGESNYGLLGRGRQLKEVNSKNGKLLAWTNNNRELSTICLWEPESNEMKFIENVKNSFWDISADKVFVITGNDSLGYKLRVISLVSNDDQSIWAGNKLPRNITFNKIGDKVAFIVSENSSSENIRIAVVSLDGTLIEIDRLGTPLDSNFVISSEVLRFDNTGKRLIFSVSSLAELKDIEDLSYPVSVDVWNYKDRLLQSQQLSELTRRQILLAFFDLNTDSINLMSLEENETYCFNPMTKIINTEQFYLIKRWLQRPNELQVFNHKSEDSMCTIFMVNSNDMMQTPIVENSYVLEVKSSPRKKFVVYYDSVKNHYYSYEQATGITRKISSGIPNPLFDFKSEVEHRPFSQPIGIAGWLEDDKALLIYDQNDIWQVDPQGKHSTICLTKEFGKYNGFELRLKDREDQISDERIFKKGERVIIKIVNLKNYNEGLTEIKIGEMNDLKEIKTQGYRVGALLKFGKYYVVKRRSNFEAPNWFLSKNLEDFTQISFINRPTEQNWFTKELINFKSLDGKLLKGTLYKPENFDVKKRYPIIFQLYEIQSDNFNDYDKPKLSNGPINAAWFASQGYLVFQPDIYYEYGNPGESALNSVLGAARFLSSFEWVDSTSMGLSGASQGGFAVNYIVAKTNKFRAAAPACGIVDLISGYNSLRESGFSRQYIYETSQGRVGATLWQRPDLYIDNSAVFNADNVATPILIMHNKGDEAVPWSQGVEWFLSLRRLGKPVWMLQYDNERHGLSDEKNCLDYTIRLKQFFDHYLKGDAEPEWMSKGVPAKYKMRVSGLGLEK